MGAKEHVLEYDYRYNYTIYDHDEIINGNYFYYGINNSDTCIPTVKEIKQNSVESIVIKKPLSDFEVGIDIFAYAQGKLIHYPQINLYIYKEDQRGFNQIIQGTPQGIFVVTIKPENIMKISLLCSAKDIYEMEFYYHGNPFLFDIELKTFLYNGSHELIPKLDKNNRLIELKSSLGTNFTRTINFENGDQYIETVPVIAVEDSVFKFCYDTNDDTCLGIRYYTEYHYENTKLVRKIIRPINDIQYNCFIECNN